MIRRGRPLVVAVWFLLLTALPVRAQEPSVRALLFYSPDDAACQSLLNDVLPPLLIEHGRNLSVLTIDVGRSESRKMFESALSALDIPSDEQFIPLIIVGEKHLSGLASIRDGLPGLIEEGLRNGGTEWPAIPGLDKVLRDAGFTQAPDTAWEKFLNDQPGNTLSVIVLAGMLFSLLASILFTFRPAPKILASIPAWVFPLLLAVGFAAAAYLTYTENTRSDVFCGGISHCTDVQNSPYSKIFGVIDVGEFGLLGYTLIGLSWLIHRFGNTKVRTVAAIAMFGFAVFGVSFSSYLTFLEPFVVGATCLWCLTSAVIMALILPLTILPVHEAIQSYTAAGNAHHPAGG
jgi:uncharacterized membrane protein